jgi:hypothetical protein
LAGLVQIKWVDLEYPEKMGIIKDLESQGYEVKWKPANKETTLIDVGGWEYVVHRHSVDLCHLKVSDRSVSGGYLILLKKKRAAFKRPLPNRTAF